MKKIIRNYKSQDFHSNFLFNIYWRSTSRKHIFYVMKIQLFCCISISWIVYIFQSQTLICPKYPGSISYQLKLISHDTWVLLTHLARKCNLFLFSTILPPGIAYSRHKLPTKYSETRLERPLPWDHLSWNTTLYLAEGPTFQWKWTCH